MVVGEKTKNKKTMQGKVTEKQIMQRRSEDKKKKKPCRVNCTVGLTNCICLKGNAAAKTLTHCSGFKGMDK